MIGSRMSAPVPASSCAGGVGAQHQRRLQGSSGNGRISSGLAGSGSRDPETRAGMLNSRPSDSQPLGFWAA